MSRRPTIQNLAETAGVSVATVNRVLAGAVNVRGETRDRIEKAAAAIGFYGAGAIRARNEAARRKVRVGALLLQPHRTFYRLLADALHDAAANAEADVDLKIEHLDDLSPENTAKHLLALAETCEAICVTAAVHPTVTQAIETVQAKGVEVFALISPLAATGQVAYVGLDNWKVGRTAAWTFAHVCKAPGKLGILMGNHRYRNQEMNEAGFRSYFRELAPGFTLLEPLSTFESSAVAHEMTEKLLGENPDLAGLYVAGGGISGALAALKANDRTDLIVVGYELMEQTRAALLDGTMTLAISHPLTRLARAAVDSMVDAALAAQPAKTSTIIPFELYTRENV